VITGSILTSQMDDERRVESKENQGRFHLDTNEQCWANGPSHRASDGRTVWRNGSIDK
jgi:hypothetical protein